MAVCGTVIALMTKPDLLTLSKAGIVLRVIKHSIERRSIMAEKKPLNSFAGQRPVAKRQRRIRREKEIAAIQRWAAGKTDTIEAAPKAK